MVHILHSLHWHKKLCVEFSSWNHSAVMLYVDAGTILTTGLYIRSGSQRSSPASLPGFTGYFHCFTSLNNYVEQTDPQPSTFHKTLATQKT